MGAGRLIFFGVVAIERRLIRWKFYDDVTAARLPFSRREGPAPHQIRRAILLEGRGRAGRVGLVCLGVGDIDPAPLLPADDSSAGFDNIADVLGLSPVLIESYLSAAGQISALAIGDPKTPPMGEVYRVRQDASQSRHVEGLPLGTVGFEREQTRTASG